MFSPNPLRINRDNPPAPRNLLINSSYPPRLSPFIPRRLTTSTTPFALPQSQIPTISNGDSRLLVSTWWFDFRNSCLFRDTFEHLTHSHLLVCSAMTEHAATVTLAATPSGVTKKKFAAPPVKSACLAWYVTYPQSFICCWPRSPSHAYRYLA